MQIVNPKSKGVIGNTTGALIELLLADGSKAIIAGGDYAVSISMPDVSERFRLVFSSGKMEIEEEPNLDNYKEVISNGNQQPNNNGQPTTPVDGGQNGTAGTPSNTPNPESGKGEADGKGQGDGENGKGNETNPADPTKTDDGKTSPANGGGENNNPTNGGQPVDRKYTKI